VLWAVLVAFWIIAIAALVVIVKPHLDRLERRREEIGPRRIPRRDRIVAATIIAVGSIAAAVIGFGLGPGPAALLAASAVIAAMFAALMFVLIRAAHRAQR
jgi:hypothetical protein